MTILCQATGLSRTEAEAMLDSAGGAGGVVRDAVRAITATT